MTEMTIAQEKATDGRIARLRKRYHDEVPRISIERADYYTREWRRTSGTDTPLPVRVALAMKNVYENMTMYVDPDDHIAGYWTEDFLGIPVDIERGVFNTVLASELDRNSMIAFHVKSFKDTFSYLLKKRQFIDFVRGIRTTRSAGPQPMNIGAVPMNQREINRFDIDPEDRRKLQKELLPYWEGRTHVDRLEKEIFGSGILGGDMRDFAMAIPANTSRQTMMISTCSTIATYQGHVIPDYEKVVREGLLAMKEEAAKAFEESGDMPEERRAVLKSIEIAIDGVITYARRLAEKIEETLETETDPDRKMELGRMLEDCRRVPLHPAETFRQAVQSAWTLKTAVEIAHPVNLHCFGRMDQIFQPYYEADIDAGRITRDEAREVLEELLLKVMSQNIRPESNILSNFYHRYLGSTPITIGGLKPDGTDGTNDLTYLFLEAADSSRAVTNVSLRVHKDSPDELYMAVADMLQEGSSNLSIFNDDVNVEAMERRGFETPDARDYAVMGCVEMLCPGKTGGMSATALLLCRVLDMTLRNGDTQTLLGRIKNVGLKTGDPDTFETFDELFDAYVAQARHQVKLIAEASNLRDAIFSRTLPAPYISAFIDGCMDNCKDVTEGGARYDLTGVSFINSIANTADSLYVIKKLVFERGEFDFRRLLKAIDSNFEGYEDILKSIDSIEGKWGNANPECDDLVRRLTDALFKETYKYTSFRGGPFVPYVISMTTHTIDGRVSIATPDGRRAATPFAASCNPFNVERNGTTGTMKSIAAIDFRHVLGCAVNMKFHPSAIGKSDEARKKWIALLRTYFLMGGAQIQPTVASAEMLRDAQKNPSEYSDLIVKVGGYSTYFVDLGREIQSEVIARTEHNASSL